MSKIKKIFSYMWIYLIIFNLFSWILLVDVKASTRENNVSLKSSSEDLYLTDRVIVKFKDDYGISSLSSLQSDTSNDSLEDIEKFDDINMWVLSFDETQTTVAEMVKELTLLPEVEYVEKDYVRSLLYTWVTTNDTYSVNQWYLDSIEADHAWEMYNDLTDKIWVLVNDTWIRYDHPDLVDNMKDLSSTCYNHSWSLISWWCANSWRDYYSDDDDPMDVGWHGTHVAWIIWAKWENSTWIIWVTQNVELMWVRVWDNSLSSSAIISWIYFAVNNGAKLINASYGWISFSQSEYDTIEHAKDNGVMLIAAAWNESSDNESSHKYPSDYNLDNIISVASVWANDTLSSFSNYWATSVDIAAPWWDTSWQDDGIYSTYIDTTVTTTLYTPDVSSASTTTQTWASTDWFFASWDGYRTNEALHYGSSIDGTLSFNTTFSLNWASSPYLEWWFFCDLWTTAWNAERDDDYWDYLEVIIEDNDTGNELVIDTINTTMVDSDYKINITDSSYYKDNLTLKFRFVSDSDSEVWEGCNIDLLNIKQDSVTEKYYEYLEWTSMAAPVVTWVASMIWSYKTDLSYTEIRDIILASISTISSLSWKVVSWGKVNAKSALIELMSRYWITKTWTFSSDFTAKNIDLSWKTITLS